MSASASSAPDKSSAAARGRSAASKPLSSSSAKSKSTASASGSSSRPPRAPSASSTLSSKSSVSGSTSVKAGKAASTSRPPSETGFKVTKLSSTTVTLQSTWTPQTVPEPAPVAPPIAEQPPTRIADPLQVAAQVYPWTYMSSTLDACFKGAEAAATNDLETRSNEVAAQESEISDQRDRLEAERSIEFFDELQLDPFVKEAPAIMQQFQSHGDSCTRIEKEALKLATRSAPDPPEEEPLKVYQDMLRDLEGLHNEATDLQSSIMKLTEAPPPAAETTGEEARLTATDSSSARSQVSGVFAACLPVLRLRISNLSVAQELIDLALENVSLGLRMESMGLTD
ncbi:hypothetical protein GALMADRAFT_236726 [Galerina marginata CBS 339.88]|uniref:Uncharacterized protein n=1 Tax=Galerina marginata (strain CBS 339.88) TaxID=685588 RepID=A0A067TP30_GALM3|nr:hypothetical protein GALMADRAFT_236726 [Galerina marginata CBS 339.88]